MQEQLTIRLPPWLIARITTAAAERQQTVDQWCADLFEVSLDPEREPSMLVERVYRLEQIVAQLSSQSLPSLKRSSSDVVPALTERQQAALDLVEKRWRDGAGETTAADLIGDAAGCDLGGQNAARMARGVLSALARKELVQLRRLGNGISARPANAKPTHPQPPIENHSH